MVRVNLQEYGTTTTYVQNIQDKIYDDDDNDDVPNIIQTSSRERMPFSRVKVNESIQDTRTQTTAGQFSTYPPIPRPDQDHDKIHDMLSMFTRQNKSDLEIRPSTPSLSPETVGKITDNTRVTTKTETMNRHSMRRGDNIRDTKAYTEVTLGEVLGEQKERKARIAKICSREKPRNLTRLQKYFHLIDDQLQLVYCSVPKAACSSFKRLFWNAHGLNSISDAPKLHGHKYMSHYGNFSYGNFRRVNLTEKIAAYKSFMFVRHPFNRLVSAYKEKFAGNNSYYLKYVACDILKEFRANYTDTDRKYCTDTTFPEFIKWVIKQGENGSIDDQHWSPYTTFCDPCKVQYDFIGKLESMTTDVAYIMKEYFHLPPSEFPHVNAKHAFDHKYYINQISREEKFKLLKIYRHEFELYGYKIMLWTINILCAHLRIKISVTYARAKWPTFGRRHFQIQFFERNVLYFDSHSTEVYS